jgi:tRNA pseudouridine38-40 synthase
MLESHQPTPTNRVALVIQYLGTHFHGWQRQKQQRTVQEEIETAIATILGYHVTLHGAGRTDAGVHAAAQVAHFDAISPIPAHKWAAVLNSYLPKDILIRASAGVGNCWHSRFSAAYRRYRYTIYTEDQPNLFVRPFSWHYYYAPLDESLIKAALKPLLGKHHLAAFHRAGSKRSHSWVEVQAAECRRSGPFIHIEIQADGFLYGMVRLLVGMVVQVGSSQRSLASFTELWKEERREEVKHAALPKAYACCESAIQNFPFSQRFGTIPYQSSSFLRIFPGNIPQKRRERTLPPNRFI